MLVDRLRNYSQSFMAAKPACVREYPPLNFSLTNSSLSVKSSSVALSCLRLGPSKHNIWPGVIRNRRKVHNTRCSDVDNKILSRVQSHVAFRDQGRRHSLGQLSPAEGVSGTACPSVCSFFLRRRPLFSSAFLFFSISRRRFSTVFWFFAMGIFHVDELVRQCACAPRHSFTTRVFGTPGQRSCRRCAEESTSRRRRFSTGGPDRLVRHLAQHRSPRDLHHRDSRAVWPRSP